MKDNMKLMFAFVIAAFAVIACAFIISDAGDSSATGTAAQADDSVASVTIDGTTTYYTSLADAVTAAQPNDSGNKATVTLLKNATNGDKSLSFTKSGEYVFDIQSYTLTRDGGAYLLTVGGDSPPVYPIDTINTSAKLTIIGTGTIVSEDKSSLLRSYGTMVFGGAGSNITVNFRQIYGSSGDNGHTIFKVEEGSFLTVESGTFNITTNDISRTRAMQTLGTTVINGGTFNGDVQLWSYTGYVSTLTVNGGTFNNSVYRCNSKAPYQLSDDDKLTVNGGNFVATVQYSGGETYYCGTLPAANDIVNNKTGSEATITLLKDTSVAESIILDSGKTITINLNGKTISFAKDENFKVYKATLILEGTGTVKENEPDLAPIRVYGSTISADSNYSVVTVGKDVTLSGWAGVFFPYIEVKDGSNTTYLNYGSVLNLNGKIEFKQNTSGYDGHGIYINGNITDNTNCPTINISNTAQISGPGDAIYAAGYAKWIIDGGTLTGTECAIEIRAGELTINGGTFTSTATEFNCTPNGDGTTTKGAAIAIAQHTTNKTINVTINGGEFKALRALNEINIQKNNPASEITLSITGGTFDGGVNIGDITANISSGTAKITADITLGKGAKLKLNENAVLTGTITGPDDNKLVAKGLKAGANGIEIIGGSLTINGTIISETKTVGEATITVSGDNIVISGSLDESANVVADGSTKVTLSDSFTNNGSIEVKGKAEITVNTVTNKGTIEVKGDATATLKSVTNEGTIKVEEKAKVTLAAEVKSTGVIELKDTAKIESSSSATSAKIENKGLIVDERTITAETPVVPLDTTASTGKVTAKDTATADKYKQTYTEIKTTEYVTATIAPIAKQVYTGFAIKPAIITFKDTNGAEVSLTEGTDYTVAYTGNTAVGTATVKVTPMGDTYGFAPVTASFTIYTDASTEGTIVTSGTSYTFTTGITTTGKLDIVLKEGTNVYTMTFAAGTVIPAGTVVSIEYVTSSMTASSINYEIKTTGYNGSFTVNVPCQEKFSKATVYCSSDPSVKVTDVKYNSKEGNVTFTADHNSTFVITLEKSSTVKVTDDGSSSDSGDYGVMIAFLLLAAALGFLAVIVKRKV